MRFGAGIRPPLPRRGTLRGPRNGSLAAERPALRSWRPLLLLLHAPLHPLNILTPGEPAIRPTAHPKEPSAVPRSPWQVLQRPLASTVCGGGAEAACVG